MTTENEGPGHWPRSSSPALTKHSADRHHTIQPSSRQPGFLLPLLLHIHGAERKNRHQKCQSIRWEWKGFLLQRSKGTQQNSVLRVQGKRTRLEQEYKTFNGSVHQSLMQRERSKRGYSCPRRSVLQRLSAQSRKDKVVHTYLQQPPGLCSPRRGPTPGKAVPLTVHSVSLYTSSWQGLEDASFWEKAGQPSRVSSVPAMNVSSSKQAVVASALCQLLISQVSSFLAEAP